jgi:hypothetical protein
VRATAGVVACLAAAAPRLVAQALAAPVTFERRGNDLVLEIGPVDVAAGHETMAVPTATLAFPAGGWLNGYDFEVVDGAGRRVPPSVAEVNVYSLAERELFTPLVLRLAAIAPGAPAATLPRLLGYRARPGDSVVVTTRLHMSATAAYTGLRARIRFPFVSASAFIGAIRIRPFAMEVLPPGPAHTFDLPVGRSTQSWEGSPATAARIVGFGCSVKAWATAIRFEDVTTRRVLWEHRLTPAADGAVPDVPVTRFLSHLGLSVHPDHVYRLTVEYDNRSGAPIHNGGTGMIAGVVLPRGDWPAPDPADAAYRADMAAIRGP